MTDQADDLFSARNIGRLAELACAEKAVAVTGFDLVGARRRALELLQAHGRMSGEDLVSELKREGFVPHDDRAFGGLFSVLVRTGKIRQVGHVARRRGHGTAGGRLWEIAR